MPRHCHYVILRVTGKGQMVLLDRKHITIILNKEKEFLYQKWKGFVPATEFRRAIDFSMDTLEACGYYRIISDITEQKVVSPSEQKYVTDEVIEFLERNKSFRLAFVVNNNTVIETCARLYDRMLEEKNLKDVNRFFASPVEAEEWLLSQ